MEKDVADIELPKDVEGREIPLDTTKSFGAACDYHCAKRAGGGKADMGIRCPNCGGQIDFHAGHINNGRVFVCEKGKPLMREVRYHCRHCDSTVIFLKKCEPKEVDHD